MGTGNQQMLDKVLVLHRCGRLTRAAAALRLIVGQGLGLGIAAVGNGHHAIFLGNQVFHRQVVLGRGNFSTALIAILATISSSSSRITSFRRSDRQEYRG